MKDKILALLNRAIDSLQAKFTPNRIAVMLTPVLASVAGVVSAWVARHFPGVELSEGTIIGFGAAGVIAAVGLVYKWLDGWQKHEERTGVLQARVLQARRRHGSAAISAATKRAAAERPKKGA